MHLANCNGVFGANIVSHFQRRSPSTKQWCCPPYCMGVNPGSCTDVQFAGWTSSTRYLRKIAGIKCQDRVPNTEVLRLCGISGIEAFLLHGRTTSLGWTRRPYGRQPDTQTDLQRTVVVRQTPTLWSTQALQRHREGQHEEVRSATQVTEHGCT